MCALRIMMGRVIGTVLGLTIVVWSMSATEVFADSAATAAAENVTVATPTSHAPSAWNARDVGIVVFSSDAHKRYGDVGKVLARQVQAALKEHSRIEPALLSPDASGEPTGARQGPADAGAEREQAIHIGQSAGVETVIFGRVLSIELGAPSESERRGTNTVLRQFETARRGYVERLTCSYTVHEKRIAVRLRVRFGMAQCQGGRAGITGDLDEEIPDLVTWVDISGDPEAYPMELRGAPHAQTVSLPQDLARRACEAVGSSIASRAMEEFGARK